MQISAKEIAQILDGSLEGDPEVLISRPGKIEEGGEGTITFLANPKYESYLYSKKAAVVLVQQDFKPNQKVLADALIRVNDVYSAVADLLEKFGKQFNPNGSVSEKASIHTSVELPEHVFVGMYAVIEKGAKIGENVYIHPQVFVGENVEIGEGTILFPGVRILHDCKIGANCILNPNVVVGSDGFGFAPQEDGTYKKIPQIGNVIIESDVEIGSNTTIDRATMGSTIIRKGVKIDNLVMIAHNVEIQENTVVAAQAGFAGSSKIGKNCRIGGQAGFVGHINIADGTQVQAQSGVAAGIKKEGTAVYGSPALPYSDYLKAYAVFKNLPALYKRINELEKEIKNKED